MAVEQEGVPLVLAAQQLGMRYDRAWQYVLQGKLEGEQRGGRWFVSRASIARMARERKRASMASGESAKSS